MGLSLTLITLVYILIILLEVPRLVVQKMWRTLAAFSILMIPAMIYSYGMVFDANLPNPTKLLEAIFKPLAMHLEQLLGTAQ